MPARILPNRPLTRTECVRRWRNRHREQYNEYQRKYAAYLREKILALYGSNCNCCGESKNEFLTIDHVKNNGSSERKKFGHRQTLYNAILEKGYTPLEYQILCMNCNWGKRRLGICPHKVSKETTSDD